jgi:3-hydroxy-9,10-secoandrosta-1,3,5(10)-triene-9,17-dione monooxygenase
MEPELTQSEIIARAAALRPLLLDRQLETEELTYYPAEVHEEFRKAGFYRMLIPRRFGGYAFDVPTFSRVIVEVSRGCPSTGWCLSLGAAHALQIGALFPEDVQREVFGTEGDFRCASFAFPAGRATPDGDGYLLHGTWPYCSGAPYSTHFLGQAVVEGAAATDLPLLFVLPRDRWTMLDDWRGSLGLRGSGSHSIRIDGGRVPARLTRSTLLVDYPVDGGTVGSRLHGDPLYAGRSASFFACELASVMVGAALAAADEYARLLTSRPVSWDPGRTRAQLPDFQRYLGLALARITTAEFALARATERYMELCRDNAAGTRPFTARDDDQLTTVFQTIIAMTWDAVQDPLMRTAGSSASRDGQRLQRYVRDMATCHSHLMALMTDPIAQRHGARHLGLRGDDIQIVP